MAILAFDNDGVLRDESVSYERCIVETVGWFDGGRAATIDEITDTRTRSNNDWERTWMILEERGVVTPDQKQAMYESEVVARFQEFYWGDPKGTGFINDERLLVEPAMLKMLGEKHPRVIVSGAPQDEVRHTLRKNGVEGYFNPIWGMHDCDGKVDGLSRVMAAFGTSEVYFCDDRPSGVKAGVELQTKGVRTFGIIPPQETMYSWRNVLMDVGAEDVFANVNEYIDWLIDEL